MTPKLTPRELNEIIRYIRSVKDNQYGSKRVK